VIFVASVIACFAVAIIALDDDLKSRRSSSGDPPPPSLLPPQATRCRRPPPSTMMDSISSGASSAFKWLGWNAREEARSPTEAGFAPRRHTMDTAMKAREFVEKVISAPFAKDGVKEDVMPAVWIGELIQVCRTGDVLLTSNKDFGAKLIQKTTRTRWNHVGIITRPSPTHAYLVEWAGGIIVADLETRLHEYAKHGSVDVCIRHLLVKGPHATRTAIEERLEAFVFMLADKNFGTNTKISMRVMLKNFRGQNLAEASHSPSREVYEDDLTELFCSKTVAVAYKAAGLLAADRKAHMFVPKHFSSPYNEHLGLIDARLSPERRVTFESRRLKDAVANVLHYRSPPPYNSHSSPNPNTGCCLCYNVLRHRSASASPSLSLSFTLL